MPFLSACVVCSSVCGFWSHHWCPLLTLIFYYNISEIHYTIIDAIYHDVLFHNAVHPVICESWHFPPFLKTFTWLIISLRRDVRVLETSVILYIYIYVLTRGHICIRFYKRSYIHTFLQEVIYTYVFTRGHIYIRFYKQILELFLQCGIFFRFTFYFFLITYDVLTVVQYNVLSHSILVSHMIYYSRPCSSWKLCYSWRVNYRIMFTRNVNIKDNAVAIMNGLAYPIWNSSISADSTYCPKWTAKLLFLSLGWWVRRVAFYYHPVSLSVLFSVSELLFFCFVLPFCLH